MLHTVVGKLIRLPLNSDFGIHIVIEKSMNSNPMLNLSMLDVIRKYFGLHHNATNLRSNFPVIIFVGSIFVGIDLTNFVTRPMCSHMINVSDKIRKILWTTDR